MAESLTVNTHKTILITGASGLIGTALTQKLLENGFSVKHLGRTKQQLPDVQSYVWDIEKGYIEPGAFDNVYAIIHLAGTNVGKGKWTEKQKESILKSRVASTQLLYKTIETLPNKPARFIGASAIGYYGIDNTKKIYTEKDAPGKDFMAKVCIEWEKAGCKLRDLCLSICFLRIGVVLSQKGGALPIMAKPIQLYAGAPIGSGQQIVSWIHIDDLVRVIMRTIEHPEMEGVYNAVAPKPVSNRDLTFAIARQLKRPIWPIHIPAFVIKTLLGEQSSIVLDGVNVGNEKLTHTGFTFEYNTIQEAVEELL